MKKFLNKAPQIVLKTMTGEKLSQGQKEAMHGIRAAINWEPTPEQRRELDAEKQRVADAEMQLQQQQRASDAAAAEALVQQQRAANAEEQTQLLRQQLEEAKAAKAALEADKALAENAKLQAELDALKQPAASFAGAPLPNYDEIGQQALDASALEAKELKGALDLSEFEEKQRKAVIKQEMESLAPTLTSGNFILENLNLTQEEYSIFAPIVLENWNEKCSQSTGYATSEDFLTVIRLQILGNSTQVDYDFTS